VRGWDPNRKWGVGAPLGLVWLEIEGGTPIKDKANIQTHEIRLMAKSD